MTMEEVLAVEDKAENIRYTHFSRNPKIAEFLKAYRYVKEYGEGVDRMCKELEAVGLQDPEFRLNAFMLQVTVRNHTSRNKKPLFEEENQGLLEDGTTIEPKTLLMKTVEEAVKNKTLTPIIAENVKKVIENFQVNQILGRKEIKNELRYGDFKAGKTIEAMKLLKMIEPIEGKGKGKYILKEP